MDYKNINLAANFVRIYEGRDTDILTSISTRSLKTTFAPFNLIVEHLNNRILFLSPTGPYQVWG